MRSDNQGEPHKKLEQEMIALLAKHSVSIASDDKPDSVFVLSITLPGKTEAHFVQPSCQGTVDEDYVREFLMLANRVYGPCGIHLIANGKVDAIKTLKSNAQVTEQPDAVVFCFSLSRDGHSMCMLSPVEYDSQQEQLNVAEPIKLTLPERNPYYKTLRSIVDRSSLDKLAQSPEQLAHSEAVITEIINQQMPELNGLMSAKELH